MAEELVYGLQILVIGMAVVFSSLLVLSYLMVLLDYFFGEGKKREGNLEAGGDLPPAPGKVSPDVVAAVAASLASFLQAEPGRLKIRIVGLQAAQTGSSWSGAGRQELMGLRKNPSLRLIEIRGGKGR